MYHIKKLEWQKKWKGLKGVSIYTANAIDFTYRIIKDGQYKNGVTFKGWGFYKDNSFWSLHDTLEEAKGRAQQHHEKLLMQFLDVHQRENKSNE